MKRFVFLVPLLLCVLGFSVDTPLPDAAAEARAQTLFHRLKCVVCEGQPLNESDALIAREMRQLVRSKIKAGESDAAIEAYLAERYGQSISTTPELGGQTLLLWAGPFLLLLFGAWRLLAKKAL